MSNDHFDDNPVIATLRRVYFGPDSASGDDIWQDYRVVFSAMPQDRRRSDLLAIDDHLQQQDLKPTRELGATISMRRQLGDIDALLRKAGR